MDRRLLALGLPLVSISCAALPRGVRHDDGLKWSAPPLERATSIRDGRTGVEISLETFLDALARADAVFLGEQHTDETTHRVELAVYEGLLARRGGRVVLAMEMFERDVQPHLDAYLAGTIDERAFLEQARPWGNYRTAYRPLIEKARSTRRPVVASNFPHPLRQRLAREGPAVLASLSGDERRQAPERLLPNSAAYWRRADNAIRGHRGVMGGGGDQDRLYSTQSLWDNSMGEACALALDAHRGHVVLHVNGGFHSAYWDGTVHQLRERRPRTKVLTVDIVPVANPGVAEVGGAAVADYVVFAEARATDLDQGAWAVRVNREHKYRLHLPAESTAERVPLLIWLGDDGLIGSDGIDLWRARLGEEAAIAVLEPLYPAVQADFSEGGRWFRAESFSEDVAAALGAIEDLWGYLLRHFPIDPARVCLGGEGTGATVVAASALLTGRMDVQAVALDPRQFSKIKDFPLPLPELRGGEPAANKKLTVVTVERDRAWWSGEIREYLDIGFTATHVPSPEDPWAREVDSENALRGAMGLAARSAPAAAGRGYVLADADSPRARHWARLLALRSTSPDGGVVVALDAPPADETVKRVAADVRVEAFAAPGALPRCPGPFGGTTVMVVSRDAPLSEVEAWLALEKDDPLNKVSRFHRVRIARDEGDRSLSDVLAGLHAEGRDNVLIVPARFCADGAGMRALERAARAHQDSMTLHWLPGLGGRLASMLASGVGAGDRRPATAPARQ